jgi:hypothetical protein
MRPRRFIGFKKSGLTGAKQRAIEAQRFKRQEVETCRECMQNFRFELRHEFMNQKEKPPIPFPDEPKRETEKDWLDRIFYNAWWIAPLIFLAGFLWQEWRS